MLPKNILFIFLLFFSVALQAQSDRITVHKALIVSDTLTPEEVLLKMKSYEKWGVESISAAEWDQIKSILFAKNTNAPTLRDQYFICYADCNKYAALKEIGNALYCIDSFYKKVKALNDDEQLMKVYQLYVNTYEMSNMIDDALKYTRLLYALKCKNKSHAEIMEFSNAFVWKFFVYGREKNDTALIQEAQTMGEKRIS
jgi:hypothetical protein